METIRSSDITDQNIYRNRREFIGTALAVAGGTIVSDAVLRGQQPAAHPRGPTRGIRSPRTTIFTSSIRKQGPGHRSSLGISNRSRGRSSSMANAPNAGG